MFESPLFKSLNKFSEAKTPRRQKSEDPLIKKLDIEKAKDIAQGKSGDLGTSDERKTMPVPDEPGKRMITPTQTTGDIPKPTPVTRIEQEPTLVTGQPKASYKPEYKEEAHWRDVVAKSNEAQRFISKSQEDTSADFAYLFEKTSLAEADYASFSNFFYSLYYTIQTSKEYTSSTDAEGNPQLSDDQNKLVDVMNKILDTTTEPFKFVVKYPDEGGDPSEYLDVLIGFILPALKSATLVKVLNNRTIAEELNEFQKLYTGSYLTLPLNADEEMSPVTIKSGILFSNPNCFQEYKKLREIARRDDKQYSVNYELLNKSFSKLATSRRVKNEQIKNISDTLYYSLMSKLLPAYFDGVEISDDAINKQLYSGKSDLSGLLQDVSSATADKLITPEAEKFLRSKALVLGEDPFMSKGLFSSNVRKQQSFAMHEILREAEKKEKELSKVRTELDVSRAKSPEIEGAIFDIATELGNLLVPDGAGKTQDAGVVKAEIDKICDAVSARAITGVTDNIAKQSIKLLGSLKHLTKEDYNAIKALVDVDLADIRAIEVSKVNKESVLAPEALETLSNYSAYIFQKERLEKGSEREWAWNFIENLLSGISSFTEKEVELPNLKYKIEAIKKLQEIFEKKGKELELSPEDQKREDRINELEALILAKTNEKENEAVTEEEKAKIDEELVAINKELFSLRGESTDFASLRAKQEKAVSRTSKTVEKSRRGYLGITNRREKLTAQANLLRQLPGKLSEIYKDIFYTLRKRDNEDTLKLMLVPLNKKDKESERVKALLKNITDDIIEGYFGGTTDTLSSLRILSPVYDIGNVKEILDNELTNYINAGLLATEVEVKSVSDYQINDYVIDLINLAGSIEEPEKEAKENINIAQEWNVITTSESGRIIPHFTLNPAKTVKDGVYHEYFDGYGLPSFIRSNAPVLLLTKARLLEKILPVLKAFEEKFTVDTILDVKHLDLIDKQFPDMRKDIINYVENIRTGISQINRVIGEIRKNVAIQYGGREVIFWINGKPNRQTLPQNRKLLSNYNGLLDKTLDSLKKKNSFIIALTLSPEQVLDRVNKAMQILATAFNYELALRSTNIGTEAKKLINTEESEAKDIFEIQKEARNYINNTYRDFAALLGYSGLEGGAHPGAKIKVKVHKNAIIRSIFDKFSFIGLFLRDHTSDWLNAREIRELAKDTSTAYSIADKIGIAFDRTYESSTERGLVLPQELKHKEAFGEEEQKSALAFLQNGVAKVNVNNLVMEIEKIIKPLQNKLTGIAKTQQGKDKFASQAYTTVTSFSEYIKRSSAAVNALLKMLKTSVVHIKEEPQLIKVLNLYSTNFNALGQMLRVINKAVTEKKLYTEEAQKTIIDTLKLFKDIPNVESLLPGNKIFITAATPEYTKKVDSILDPIGPSESENATALMNQGFGIEPAGPLLLLLQNGLTLKQIADQLRTLFIEHQDELTLQQVISQSGEKEKAEEEIEGDKLEAFSRLLVKATSSGEYNWKTLLRAGLMARGPVNVYQIYATLFDKETYNLLLTKNDQFKLLIQQDTDLLERKKAELDALKQSISSKQLGSERPSTEVLSDRSKEIEELDSQINKLKDSNVKYDELIKAQSIKLASEKQNLQKWAVDSPDEEKQKEIIQQRQAISKQIETTTGLMNSYVYSKKQNTDKITAIEREKAELTGLQDKYSKTLSDKGLQDTNTEIDATRRTSDSLESEQQVLASKLEDDTEKYTKFKYIFKTIVKTALTFNAEANSTMKIQTASIVNKTLEATDDRKASYNTIRTNKITDKIIKDNLISVNDIKDYVEKAGLSSELLESIITDSMVYEGLLEAVVLTNDTKTLLRVLGAMLIKDEGLHIDESKNLISRTNDSIDNILERIASTNLWLMVGILASTYEKQRSLFVNELKKTNQKMLFIVKQEDDLVHKAISLYDFNEYVALVKSIFPEED